MRYGLVLYGTLPVGKFTSLSVSNQITDLHIENDFVDIPMGTSKEELQFVIVEEIGDKYVRVVENLGLGKFQGKPFINERVSLFKEAVFIKSLNKTLN